MDFKNFTIIGLLLLNLGLIGLMFFGRGSHGKHRPPSEKRLIKKMKHDFGLSEAQIADVKKIKIDHEDFVKSTFDKADELKDQFSEFFTDEELDTANLAKVVKEVSALTLSRDSATIMYVRNIRSVLDSEQKKKFDKRYKEFIPRPGKPHSPKRRR